MASEKDKFKGDVNPKGPQGFKWGQLRKRGYFFCLRGCKKFFETQEEEKKHYEGGPLICPKSPYNGMGTFNPLNIKKIKNEEELEEVKAMALLFAIEMAEKREGKKSATTDSDNVSGSSSFSDF